MKRAVSVALRVLLFAGVIALIVFSIRRSARTKAANLELVRNDPRIQEILDGMNPVQESGGFDHGVQKYVYSLSVVSLNLDNCIQAQKPYLVLRVDVDEQGWISIGELTLYSEKGAGKLTTEAFDAVRTICFWFPAREEKKSYIKNGRYEGEGTRETCNAYLYDVESGRYIRWNWIQADSLPETAGSLPRNTLQAGHFKEFIERAMGSRP